MKRSYKFDINLIQLGNYIRYYRESLGMTQVTLEKLLGVSEGYVYKWESGYKIPSLQNMAGLSLVLGFDLSTIINKCIEDSVDL